jgi:hypothetical protein
MNAITTRPSNKLCLGIAILENCNSDGRSTRYGLCNARPPTRLYNSGLILEVIFTALPGVWGCGGMAHHPAHRAKTRLMVIETW